MRQAFSLQDHEKIVLQHAELDRFASEHCETPGGIDMMSASASPGPLSVLSPGDAEATPVSLSIMDSPPAMNAGRTPTPNVSMQVRRVMSPHSEAVPEQARQEAGGTEQVPGLLLLPSVFRRRNTGSRGMSFDIRAVPLVPAQPPFISRSRTSTLSALASPSAGSASQTRIGSDAMPRVLPHSATLLMPASPFLPTLGSARAPGFVRRHLSLHHVETPSLSRQHSAVDIFELSSDRHVFRLIGCFRENCWLNSITAIHRIALPTVRTEIRCSRAMSGRHVRRWVPP
jgi:hypothetical protein